MLASGIDNYDEQSPPVGAVKVAENIKDKGVDESRNMIKGLNNKERVQAVKQIIGNLLPS